MGKSLSMPKSISKKLMAATSMLLVATIMMVSSTYAWFTLSTAPEVTGISTTVGANGNLEIALASYVPGGDGVQPVDTWANPQLIPSGEGTSGVNETWGNLVDLENYNSASGIEYGLDKIKLMPARLNVDNSGKVPVNSILMTPSYGADGRVSIVTANTVTGTYDYMNSQSFKSNDAHGVRAIGAATSMSDRQIAYRDASNNITSSANAALRLANQSLYQNGGALVGIAVAKSADDNATFTKSDVDALDTMVTALEESSENLEELLRASMIGILASKHNTKDDTTTLTAIATVKAADYATLKTAINTQGVAGVLGTEATEKLNAVFTKVDSIKAKLTTARTAVNAAKDKDTVTWNEISDVITALMNISSENLKFNNFAIKDINNNKQALIDSVLAGAGFKLVMGPGTGVYSEIADICGNIDTSIILPKPTVVEGYDIGGANVSVKTATTQNPLHFEELSATVKGFEAPVTDTAAQSVAITDLYGYAIDLVFRTNASGANLLLQTEATNRIYSNSTESSTMGGGSNMTFTGINANFTTDMMKNLMSSVRVVFLSYDGTILQRAKLDTANAEVSGTGEVKADLLVYTIDDATKEETFSDDATLTALPQNTEERVSVIVYLDGDKVTNSMVANGEYSMTGYLNLQFATDATLVPMDYTQFQQVTSGDASSN